MKLNIQTFTIVLCLFSIVACAPSEQVIQLALAQTQTAMATNTFTSEPTRTFTPEPTFTPTPTTTQTYTPTPTATQTYTPTPDLRVITIDSKELLLTKDDLPIEAMYYLPNSTWISPHLNSEVISGWGREKGLIYLEETGRIDGWWVYYNRGNNTVRAPEEIYQNIVQYKTSEGALLTFTKYGFDTLNLNYSIINNDIKIGDNTIFFVRKIMQPSGNNRVRYVIQSQYRNYLSIVGGWGWEKEFDLEYVIKVAEIAVAKLEAAPLGNW